MNLSPRQLQTLRIIAEYRDRTCLSPTNREIAARLGCKSIWVFEIVKALEKKGAIERTARGLARSYGITPAGRLALSPKPTPKWAVAGTLSAAGMTLRKAETPQ